MKTNIKKIFSICLLVIAVYIIFVIANNFYSPFRVKGRQMSLLAKAILGNRYAQYNLAEKYNHGAEGFMQDDSKAMYWMNRAAKKGDSDAEAVLGAYYIGNSMHTPKDAFSAVKWLMASSDQNNPKGNYGLGLCYWHGIGLKADHDKAIFLITKSAEKGFGPAQCYLGLLYLQGKELKKNYVLGTNWLQKAAEQDIPTAEYELGLLLLASSKTNSNQAISWLEKSADNGLDVAEVSLAEIYQNGYLVNRDIEKSIKLYQQAADLGNPAALTKLGLMYQYGFGVKTNFSLAVEYYIKASNKGYEPAKHRLASIINDGVIK